jgi:hypothetical protein
MIKYNGMKFDSIRTFDCITLSFSGGTGGNYTTCLPISDKQWREQEIAKGRNMKAKVEVKNKGTYTQFNITDDWGTIETVIIDNIHDNEIKHAVNKAKEYGLVK